MPHIVTDTLHYQFYHKRGLTKMQVSQPYQGIRKGRPLLYTKTQDMAITVYSRVSPCGYPGKMPASRQQDVFSVKLPVGYGL